MKYLLGLAAVAAAGAYVFTRKPKPYAPKPIDSRIDMNQSNPVIIPEQKSDVLNAVSMNKTNLEIQTSKPLTTNMVNVNLKPMRLNV